jgi:transcriptional regulator with XRE-family HTH domain
MGLMLTGPQVRAARSLLGWTQSTLAEKSKLGFATIQRVESQSGPIHGMTETVLKLKDAMESAGIIFIDEDRTAGPGVRLMRSKTRKAPRI